MKGDREYEIAALVRSLVGSDWTAEEIARMRGDDCLITTRQVVNGRANVQYLEHVIDLDSLPYVPEGWQLVSCNRGGLFTWDADQIGQYRNASQLAGQVISGERLLESLEEAPILNSNLLDHLLQHPRLIPDEWKVDKWKGRPVYTLFSGSIFIDEEGARVVRALAWNNFVSGGRWLAAKVRLAGGFGIEFPSLAFRW